MEKILVLNAKGGCGKTTIATNLASHYASAGFKTVLMDYDPQGSSMRWIRQRPQDKPQVDGVNAYRRPGTRETKTWSLRTPVGTQRIIMDAPAGVAGAALVDFVCQVNTILIPVLPSPIDIHAATRFIEDLLLIGKVRQKGVRVAVIANRVNKQTLVYQSLELFLKTLNLPFIATLRDTQNYVHAAERGIGIHEMWDRRADSDRLQWQPVLKWLEGSEVRWDVISSSA
jgi:chromosome partitioning protein